MVELSIHVGKREGGRGGKEGDGREEHKLSWLSFFPPPFPFSLSQRLKLCAVIGQILCVLLQ